MTSLLRMPDIMTRMGLKKSSVYNMVNEGTLTQPIKMGKRLAVWPDYEIESIIQAIVRNDEKDSIRAMVNDLMSQRHGSQP